MLDPMHLLSAAEMSKELEVDPTHLEVAERTGQFFCLSRPCRGLVCGFPVFQSWAGIRGEKLTRVLDALSPCSRLGGTAPYQFFAGTTDMLLGLTPVEVMVGRELYGRQLDADARHLLAMSDEQRLTAVLAAARSYASTIADW